MKACGGINHGERSEYARLEPWQNTQPIAVGNSSGVNQTEGFSGKRSEGERNAVLMC